jgi:hypothetical protein
VKDERTEDADGDDDGGPFGDLLPADFLAPREDRLGMAKVFLGWNGVAIAGLAIARKLGRIPRDRLDAAYAALEVRIRETVGNAEETLKLIRHEREELALEITTRGAR